MDPLKLRVSVFPHTKLMSMGRCVKDGLPVNFGDASTWGEALTKHYPTPALAVGYSVVGEPRTPRLAKRDERQIAKMGGEVLVHTLMIDYDLPKVDGQKVPWTDPDAAWDVLAKLTDSPGLWPTAFYTTKHGARLVYVLSHMLSPQDSEHVYKNLIDELRKLGIESDENTKDWTRMFVLPYVTKDDGEKLWENETIWVETFPDHTLNPDLLMGQAAREFEPCIIDSYKPDARRCDILLRKDGKATAMHRIAKKKLDSNDFLVYLFDNGATCDFPAGERDTRINAMAWSVVRGLYGKKGLQEMGPEFPYAVMRHGVSQMPRDEDDPDKDWTDTLWEKTCRIWESMVDEAEMERLDVAELEEEVLVGFKKQLMRDNANIRELMVRYDIETEVGFMKRHMILQSKGEIYMLGRDGFYQTRPVHPMGMHGQAESQGLGSLYGLLQFGERVSEVDLRREYGITVHQIEGRLGLDRGQIAGLGTECVRLQIPTYYVRPLEPLFVPQVDQWLKALAGDYYERLTDWIGHAQQVDRPICALSLTGGPGAGKTFLAELMGERFGPGGKNAEQVFGKWNIGLRDNPVINLDEHITGPSIDGKFREYVTGGNLMLSQRNVDERSYEVYPRVIVTANNLEALTHIVASRDLDDESHRALVERILHIQVDEEAKEMVRREETENWIRGDRLALRHFAWLYENRAQPSQWQGSGRFLVEGEQHSEVLQEARFNSPMVEAVMDLLVSLIESPGNSGDDINIREDLIHCSATKLAQVMKAKNAEYYHLTKSAKGIGAALRKLSIAHTSNPVRIWHVPVEPILRHAMSVGAKCPRLREIYETHHGEEAIKRLEKVI